MAPSISVTSHNIPTTINHANKRRASDDPVESQSNISSHFKRLRLQNGTAHPPPVPVGVSFRSHSQLLDTHSQHLNLNLNLSNHINHHNHGHGHGRPHQLLTSPTEPFQAGRPREPPSLPVSPRSQPKAAGQDDIMPVDETPHRIIIHDLASEIAEIEAEEAAAAQTVYLPDLDKKVSAIPQRLLQRRDEHSGPDSNTALVLYRAPSSISVPEEDDAVRRAIMAARERVRERQEAAIAAGRREEIEPRVHATPQRRRPPLTGLDTDSDDAMTDGSAQAEDDDAMEIE